MSKLLRVLLATLLLGSLLFASRAPLIVEKRKDSLLSKKELLILFSELYKTVSKNYYMSGTLEYKTLTNKFEALLKENRKFSKSEVYQIFNELFEGKSGFYTQATLEKKFHSFLDDTSRIEIMNIDDILYIKIENLNKKDLGLLESVLNRSSKKIIVDVRNNIDSDVDTMIKFANLLVDDAIIASCRYVNPKKGGKISTWVKKADSNVTLVGDAKIVFLINNKTAGIAEVVAHSLRYNRNIRYSIRQRNVTVIGEESAGESNSFVTGRLSNGDVYILKNGEFYYNLFYVIDRIGLQPSIVVKEDNPAIDKTLLRAVESLRRKK